MKTEVTSFSEFLVDAVLQAVIAGYSKRRKILGWGWRVLLSEPCATLHGLPPHVVTVTVRYKQAVFSQFDLRHPDVLPVRTENKIKSTSNTLIFINRSGLHVSTLTASKHVAYFF